MRSLILFVLITLAFSLDERQCPQFWDNYAIGRNPTREEFISGLKSLVSQAKISYSQTSERWSGIMKNVCPPNLPPYADSSSFVSWAFWTAFGKGEDVVNGAKWKRGNCSYRRKEYTVPVDECKAGDTIHFTGHFAIYAGDNHYINFGSNGPVSYLELESDATRVPDYCIRQPLNWHPEERIEDNSKNTPGKYEVTCLATNIREGPSTTFKAVGTTKKGDIVTVSEFQDGFAQIGTNQWVSFSNSCFKVQADDDASLTKIDESASPSIYWVTADILRCHVSASKSSKVTGQLPQFTRISVGISSGKWIQVTSSLCKDSYVSKDYLTSVDPTVNNGPVKSIVQGTRQDTEPRPVSPSIRAEEVVYYRQGDPRWGKKVWTAYNDKSQNYGNSACGPTSMAMVVATMADKSVTPVTMGDAALKYKCRSRNDGTVWKFFCLVAKDYNLECTETKDTKAVVAALKEGKLVVAAMGRGKKEHGYWTTNGHFITLIDADDTYIYAHDPATTARVRDTIKHFDEERGGYFIFSK